MAKLYETHNSEAFWGFFSRISTAGIRLAELTVGMENGTYSLEEVSALTNQTYGDSFLYQLGEEIYRRLGIAGK